MDVSLNDFKSPANILSLLRIPLAVIMVLFYEQRYIFLSILCVAILTDALDGYVARKTKPTDFGVFLDPLCDKIFFAILIIFLLFTDIITFSQMVLLLLRDFLMVCIVTFVIVHPKRALLEKEAKARLFGKATTALQFVALLWLFFEMPYFQYLVFFVAALSLIAVIDYSSRLKKILF